MRSFLVLQLLLVIGFMNAQEPVSVIEGRLEIHSFDTTSVFIGKNSGMSYTASSFSKTANTLVGANAGELLNHGSENTFVGAFSGRNSGFTFGNVFLGSYAGVANETGNGNSLVGAYSGINIRDGSGNTVLGNGSGNAISTGIRNVMIGQNTGPSSGDPSHRLYINNDLSNTPLIYGEFDNSIVAIRGKLGVGKQDPDHSMDVEGVIKASNGSTGGPQITGILEAAESRRPVLLFSEGGDTFGSGMSIEYNGLNNGGSNYMTINKTGGNPLITFKNDGNVGIGTITPTAALEVVGDIIANNNVEISGNLNLFNIPTGGTTDVRVDGAGRISKASSDIRLKRDIFTLENALEKVTRLRGVKFTWKSEPSSGQQLGVIAQEVQEVVPELITNSDGYLGVDHSEMVALFIEAIKEQQQIIEALENRIKTLELKEK